MSKIQLTHWGRVTHICVGKLTIIGSDNGLLPGWRLAIIWPNAIILLIQTLGTNYSEIFTETHVFSFKKMHFKMSSAKLWQFGLGLNVLSVLLLPKGGILGRSDMSLCIANIWYLHNDVYQLDWEGYLVPKCLGYNWTGSYFSCLPHSSGMHSITFLTFDISNEWLTKLLRIIRKHFKDCSLLIRICTQMNLFHWLKF